MRGGAEVRMHCFPTLLAVLLLATPALAAPRSIADCEAIKDANAYNLCLASFGPMRGQHGANYPGVATEGEKGAGDKGARASSGKGVSSGGTAARRDGHSHGARAGVRRGHGGRVRMEFSPGGR
ncbi:MAG: hypothetical protein CTY15_03910 [Methylocystis sp.]|nr:MAG: hypothetical protein CTY15_03910 [Methylocystis sp.]